MATPPVTLRHVANAPTVRADEVIDVSKQVPVPTFTTRWVAAAGLLMGVPWTTPAGSRAAPQSMIADPQQGATSQPVAPPPPLPRPQRVGAPPSMPTRLPQPLPPVHRSPMARGRDAGAAPPASLRPAPPVGSWARQIPGGLPAPGNDPLNIDPASDPVLLLVRAQTPMALFERVIAQAVLHNPSLDEARAEVDEAAGVRGEAKARAMPVADFSISTFRIIDRVFSNDPQNILERSRPDRRTDGLVRVQQPIVDFGASLSRIRASEARLEAARAGVEDSGTRIALQAVSAWYNVYGYRILVRLSDAFATTQRSLRRSIEQRVEQGAAAAGDVAQVDSYIASSEAQLADFRRQLASAEAQYSAVIGSAAPANLSRAPEPALAGIGADTLSRSAEGLPIVRAARLGAEAARQDARAVRADRLPQLSAGFDAGRYGIVESRRDYDIRGSLTLSMRLGGGSGSRINQAQARAEGAGARLRRTRIEAERDMRIALSDVHALEEARAAIETNYIASRRSRDVLAERFRVSRGTLFDLLGAQSNYFGVAARYLQTVIELDTARYALLARTGRLLPVLNIQPDALEPR